MSERKSKDVQGQKEKEKGGKIAFLVGGVVLIVAIVVIVVLVLANRSNDTEEDESVEVPVSSESGIVGTIVDESYSAPSDEDSVGLGYYEVMMSTTEWYVDSKTLSTSDVYITNASANVYDMYFELVEESEQKLLYTSSILKIGDTMENLTLDTSLDAGKHTCVMVHHFLDPLTGEEIDGLSLYVDVVVY